MALGLFARHRTGQGQYVESSMIVSNIYLNCDDALSYEGKPPRREVDHLQLGTGPTRRLYETAAPPRGASGNPYENPDSHWVFLSAESDQEFRAFCEVAGRPELAADERFATAAARDRNGAALSEAPRGGLPDPTGCAMGIEPARRRRRLRDRGRHVPLRLLVPGPSGSGERHHGRNGAPQLRRPLLASCSDAAVLRHARRGRPHCELGEHTRAILQELGYDQSEMTEFGS